MPVPRRGARRPLCSCWLAFLLSLFLHAFLCHPWLAKKCAFWVLVTLTRIQLRHAGWLRRQGLTSMSQNLLQIDNCCFPWQGVFLCATLMTAIPCLVATDEVQLTPRWWRFPLGKYCSLTAKIGSCWLKRTGCTSWLLLYVSSMFLHVLCHLVFHACLTQFGTASSRSQSAWSLFHDMGEKETVWIWMRSVLLRLGGIKVDQLQVAAQKDLWKDIKAGLDIIEKYSFLWKIGDRRTLTSLPKIMNMSTFPFYTYPPSTSIHLHPLGHHTAWMFDAIGLRQQRHGARQLHDALVAVAPAAFLHDLLFKDALIRQPGDGECIRVIGNLMEIFPPVAATFHPQKIAGLNDFCIIIRPYKKAGDFMGGIVAATRLP